MFDVDDLIEIDNKTYLITHKLVEKGVTYYYISAIDKKQIALVKEEIIEGESNLISVKDDKDLELILSLMLKNELTE